MKINYELNIVKGQDFLSLDNVESCFERSKYIKRNLKYIKFSKEMGDPISHPDIYDFLEYAADIAEKVYVNTQASSQDSKWFERIAVDFQDEVFINFFVNDMQDTSALDNIKTWFSEDGEGTWHFMVTDENINDYLEAYNYAKEINAGIYFETTSRFWGQLSEHNYEFIKTVSQDLDVEVLE
jgi:hypothetical protein